MSSTIWNKPSSVSSGVTYRGGKHPPFPTAGATHHRDWLSHPGATALGEIARAAWAKAGHDVPFVVEQVTTNRSGQPMFAPRFPTLVNGMPTNA